MACWLSEKRVPNAGLYTLLGSLPRLHVQNLQKFPSPELATHTVSFPLYLRAILHISLGKGPETLQHHVLLLCVTISFLHPDSPVAFYVKHSEGKEGLSLNRTYLNYGEGYFPEHGYFKSPHSGVYMVAISMESSPGMALGQLVFSNGHRMTVMGSKKRRGHEGGTISAFVLVELRQGEHMWFELLQGSTVVQNPAGMSMAGFLIFKT